MKRLPLLSFLVMQAFVLSSFAHAQRTSFLVKQWTQNGNNMCQYDTGSVINNGSYVCPPSRDRSGPSASPRARFLVKQWFSNANNMCQYDDGTILNLGPGVCPPSM